MLVSNDQNELFVTGSGDWQDPSSGRARERDVIEICLRIDLGGGSCRCDYVERGGCIGKGVSGDGELASLELKSRVGGQP